MLTGVAGLAGGVFSHLALDALPHYNWIVYLSWFQGVPFHWLIREAVCAVPVVAVAMFYGRARWVLAGLALFGSMYPDFEKVAFVDFHIPQQFVIFRAHSRQLSSHTGGWPQPALIALEMVILVTLVAMTIGLAQWRRQSRRRAG